MTRPHRLSIALCVGLGAACIDVSQVQQFGVQPDAGGELAANGAACHSSSDCASGFCAAGVCCNNGCSGACETCDAPGRAGTCTVRSAGSACGDFACDGTRGVCPLGCASAAQCAPGRSCLAPPDGVCVDDDECTTGGRCGANATCTNTPGSYVCACELGYAGASTTGGPTTCADVDECAVADVCGDRAVCTNTEGSFECSCAPGSFGATVLGGPASCSAVNNCGATDQCGQDATCTSTATSYRCTCNAGFSGPTTEGAPATCVDADECQTAGVCGPGATCLNTTGSFTCTCRPGFVGATTSGTAATCTDVDECATSGLCGPNGVCANSPAGSYTCSCGPGFFGAPVVGGPAVCSTVDNCTSSTTCGANATCATTPTSYTCSCNPGYEGATTTGAPATCADVNECAQPGVCGANATCANTPGSYTCSCSSGYSGPTTTGMPTTCAQSLQVLGTATGATAQLVVTMTQTIPAGSPLIAVYTIGGTHSPSIADSRGNAWTRLVHGQTCNSCGATGVFFSTLTTALQTGDTISLGGFQQRYSGLWVARAPAFPYVDRQGTAQGVNTNAPSATTSQAVSDPFELIVGALATASDSPCKPGVLLTPNTPSELALRYGVNDSSGVIGYHIGSNLSGPQAFSATSPTACRFSGAVVTFYGGAPTAPTNLTLTHSTNVKNFSVGWAAGRGNGGATGCQVQVRLPSATWTTVGTANCDVDTSNRSMSLPSSDGWSGGAWDALAVRLVRASDGAILGTFPGSLECKVTAASSTPTPSIDEDCNGAWDNATCQTFGWAAQGTYPTTFTACTNTSGVATTFACTASAAGVKRYTNGTGTAQSHSPATNWSSDTQGTACQGSYQGTTEWLCAGSNCTYR